MNPVKIVKTDQISPPPGPFSSPGDLVPLSFFDTFWVAVPPVQLLFLYPNHPNDDIPILKSSLSKTLLNFHSLTGQIAYIPSTEDMIIDCRREINEGVTFIEAKCDTFSVEELAKDPMHNVHAFEKLVPSIDNDALPFSALKVQFTEFVSGGVAMGITFNHMATDGNGIWQFIRQWSRCCRGDKEVGKGVLGTIVDRALVNCQSGSEVVARRFVKQLRPDFPDAKSMSAPVQLQPKVIRKTLHISEARIEKIREEIMDEASDAKAFTSPPSKFIVLTSIVWVCFAKAKAISYEGISIMGIVVDTRPYLDPVIPENYTGNCLKPLYAKIKCSKLLSKDGLLDACKEIIYALNNGINDPLKGHEEWVKEIMMHPPSMKFRVNGSPKFIPYDLADFGWGRPERVEVASLGSDGCVNYFRGKEDGQVQLSVALGSLCMDKFVEEFTKFSNVGIMPSSILSRI